MTYQETMEFIHSTLKFGSKLGLENITKLLELMDNPHKKLRFVHVAGTNGKGSTTAFISNILIAAGYRTGMYTSPYISRFTERIQVNNQEIQPDELTEIILFTKEKIDQMLEIGYAHPTEFEIITAAAFEYFYRKNCDIVVLEVGLGGRYDATNVIESPEVSVITTISPDHTDRLGATLGEIAYQKAGIIKKDCSTVVYPTVPEVREVFAQVCEEKNSILQIVDFSSLNLKEYRLEGQIFDYKNYNQIELQMLGDHQLCNAALAIDVCELLRDKGFGISEGSIRNGLKNTVWPGRLEIINQNPLIMIDGAHNVEGAVVLKAALDKYFADREKIFVVGFLKDKEYLKIMALLSGEAHTIIAVASENERALSSSALADALKDYSGTVINGGHVENGIKIALENIMRQQHLDGYRPVETQKQNMICVFGSLSILGTVRSAYRNS